jgi:NADP-reducing hydrogenase subunit HndB
MAEKKRAPKGTPKKLTIQDLAKIRDKARSMMTVRDGEGRARVTVHMGTCGIAAGAREIMDALLDQLAKSKIKDVIVTTSGCAGFCNREPMATVEIKGHPPVKYIDLTPAKIRKIVDKHIRGGHIVTEHALAIGSETVY